MSSLQYSILNVPVDAQTFDEALSRLQLWISTAARCAVSTCTVYTVMAAQEDDAIMASLQHADMITADGMPLVWLQKAAGFRQAERVYGPDVFLALCASTQTANVRHFLLGGSPDVNRKLTQTLQEQFPGIQIVGDLSPQVPLDDLRVDEELVQTLNAAQANVIWVGLGSPKQDLWMHAYRPHLDAALLIGVGAAFDFVAGVKAQAPPWMRRSGLEWVFRLVTEPQRLWKRYLVYNTLFMYAILRDWLKTKSHHQSIRPTRID